MRVFLFLFLLFPIIELALLIKVGSAIGVLPTLMLVIGTAILGSVLPVSYTHLDVYKRQDEQFCVRKPQP